MVKQCFKIKSVLKSRTLWVNLIALTAILLQDNYGVKISPEAQLKLLIVLNIILRLVTDSKLTWSGKG
jgi:hypothetical protein